MTWTLGGMEPSCLVDRDAQHLEHSKPAESRGHDRTNTTTSGAAKPMTDILQINGERIRLRPVCSDDAEETASLMTEDVARELISWTYPMSPDAARTRIHVAEAELKRRSSVNLAILEDRSERLMGWVGFERTGAGACRVGYWIGSRFQRQGFMVEALQMACPPVTRFLKTPLVRALVSRGNYPSISVLRQCGFNRDPTIEIPAFESFEGELLQYSALYA
jgi:RimJ/RimL family protein N-acetyltransferase